MEPTKQGGDASSSEPAADLRARTRAMLHDGPSPTRQQPRSLVPTTTPLLLSPQSYGGGESSSSVNIWEYDEDSLRLAAAAVSYPPVAPKPSNLNPSAEEFIPDYLFRAPSVVQPSPTSSSSASQRQPSASLPQPVGAAVFSAPGDNASLDPYVSDLLSALRDNQAAPQFWSPAPAIRTAEQVRARLLLGSMVPGHVRFAESSAHVVQLLAEGGEEAVRLKVLDGVKRAVHSVMGSSEWGVVFRALLRACVERVDELQGIVNAACSGMFSLMNVAKHHHGETSLTELIRAVAPYPELCQQLLDRLLRDRLMEQYNGAELLHHIFTTLPYEHCSIIIQFAINNFDRMLSSESGSKCLVECFSTRKNDELCDLDDIILSRTRKLAQEKHSSLFLQQVLERGSEPLKEGITKRVVDDLVSLSGHQFGNYVVQACFLRTGSVELLQRVLTAFRSLSDAVLVVLVQGKHSNHIVSKLLLTGVRQRQVHVVVETRALARQIKGLPLDLRGQIYARWVMSVVWKVLSGNQPPH